MKKRIVKKYRLKENAKMIILSIMLLFILLLCLIYMDKKNYNDAVKRCNGKNNIILKYTNSGDRYYLCK